MYNFNGYAIINSWMVTFYLDYGCSPGVNLHIVPTGVSQDFKCLISKCFEMIALINVFMAIAFMWMS